MIDWDGAQAAISLISGKWDLDILAALENDSKRYNELARHTGIRHKVLTETLQRLERIGLVSRSVHAGTPPEVWYELTLLAYLLRYPLEAIALWGQDCRAGLASTGLTSTPPPLPNLRSPTPRIANGAVVTRRGEGDLCP